MTEAQRSYAEMSESEKKKEDWMNSKWRPAMGWLYMLVCLCDFVVFPVLWSVFHAIIHSTQVTQWQPLTLQGAGLFHLAMGAVLGLAAWGRTQEKLGGANNGGLGAPGGFGGGMGSPGGFGGGMGSPGGFNSMSSSPAPRSFGAPAPASSGFSGGFNKSATATSSCGRAMPMQDDDPVL